MSNLQAIADRVEIEALWGEFTDAEMMDDYDRFASLFTPDGVWRVPAVSAEFAGRVPGHLCAGGLAILTGYLPADVAGRARHKNHGHNP